MPLTPRFKPAVGWGHESRHDRRFGHDLHLPFKAGQVIHVPVGIKHAVYADQGEAVVSVGGLAPADKGMLRAAGLLAATERKRICLGPSALWPAFKENRIT